MGIPDTLRKAIELGKLKKQQAEFAVSMETVALVAFYRVVAPAMPHFRLCDVRSKSLVSEREERIQDSVYRSVNEFEAKIELETEVDVPGVYFDTIKFMLPEYADTVRADVRLRATVIAQEYLVTVRANAPGGSLS